MFPSIKPSRYSESDTPRTTVLLLKLTADLISLCWWWSFRPENARVVGYCGTELESLQVLPERVMCKAGREETFQGKPWEMRNVECGLFAEGC